MIETRIKTFTNIKELLKNKNTTLYNLKYNKNGSLFDGDYGLVNILDNIYYLLGIKQDSDSKYFVPQSWMVGNRKNRLTYGNPAIPIKKIKIILKENLKNELLIFN